MAIACWRRTTGPPARISRPLPREKAVTVSRTTSSVALDDEGLLALGGVHGEGSVSEAEAVGFVDHLDDAARGEDVEGPREGDVGHDLGAHRQRRVCGRHPQTRSAVQPPGADAVAGGAPGGVPGADVAGGPHVVVAGRELPAARQRPPVLGVGERGGAHLVEEAGELLVGRATQRDEHVVTLSQTAVRASAGGAAEVVARPGGMVRGMKCPVCDVALSISSREGVEIDFCPQCRGVWLDRGELDKVIERAAASLAPATAAVGGDRGRDDRYDDRPRYDDDRRRSDDRRDDDRRYDDRDRYSKKKKRRSFLDDLFEFD